MPAETALLPEPAGRDHRVHPVADLRSAFGDALVMPTEDTDLFGFTWYREDGG